ncbi:MAG: PHP domain-containing protein [Christensenellales bacterium]|jgi:predicted metal-dependent phosphoesterase TrpH
MKSGVKLDLHLHTTASDASASPQDVVRASMEGRLHAIAIADHDTVSGVQAAQAASEALSGPMVIAGVELSVEFATELHILGYFVDIHHPELLQAFETLQYHRRRRTQVMLERLKRLNMPLETQDVLRYAGGESMGRVHIARAMAEKGYVKDMDEAFEKWLVIGRPAYVPRERFKLEESIDLLHRAGAAACWAHPNLTTRDETTQYALLRRMADLGLDGVECYCPTNSPQDERRLRGWCQRLRLKVTGGSDWHGTGDARPGSATAHWPVEKDYPNIAGQIDRRERFL